MTPRKDFDLFEATLYRLSLLRRIKYPRVQDMDAIRRKVTKGKKMRPTAFYNALERAIASAAAEKREAQKRKVHTV